MLTGPNVILTLKVAVSAVTVLLLASLVALARGNHRLHGRINVVFFTLTLVTVLGFEAIIQLIEPTIFQYIKEHAELRRALNIHLCFSVPSALLMPAMLYTGLTHRRQAHLILAVVFGLLWTGTVVTGVLLLPHTAAP
ncbi:MAG: DUF420 domain-containing protein [Planctomycetia bacterium]|nr:DUF420 domain-containing protein [Planctomycetia bacterium]